MRVFLTGGAGFIGLHLARRLLRQHSVRIYDDLSSPSERMADMVSREIDFVRGDILSYRGLVESSRGFDAVIHLAARSDVGESILNPEETELVNVQGTRNVVGACRANGIDRIVFASSAAVYGDSGRTPVTEGSAVNPISPYGRTKLDGEGIIRQIKNNVVLRLFNVYGKKGKHNTAVSSFADAAESGRNLVIYGDGEQVRDFVHVSDAAGAFVHALGMDGERTFNVASGIPVSINELADLIISKSATGCKKTHKGAREGEIRYSVASIKAIRDAGYAPGVTLDEGLAGILG